MHHFWHYEGKTDLSKMQEEARERLNDRRTPEESIIHLHPFDEDCLTNPNRDPNTHDIYEFDFEKEVVDA